jgi:signal transduction histidine kinase
VGFRVRQAVTLGLTALAVALATGLISAAILVRLHVLEARDHAELLARTLYHLTSQAIRQHAGEDLRHALATDRSLREYTDAVIGYSPIVLNVAIKDHDGIALLHSDARKQGRRVLSPETFTEFSTRSSLAQFWLVLDGQRDLVAELPFSPDGQEPFGTVAVVVSTVLLRQSLMSAVVTNACVAGIAVLLAFLAAFLVSNRLLAPIARLRAELARIVPADDLKNDADISRLVEFFTTVSERLAAGRHERDAREATKSLLDGLSDAVLVVGRELDILSLNDEAVRLLGCGRAELERGSLARTLAPTDPLRLLVEETLSRGETQRSRSALLVVAGREVPFLLDAFVLRERDRALGVMITARDLERSSQIGSRLSHSQKLAALGRLTSGVAHEIRNPLNALVLQAALLRQKLGPAVPHAARHLDIIEEEVKRLDRVIDGFLRFTRPEELQLETVRLDGILREAMDLMAARAEHGGIRMEAAVAPDLPRVRGSAELLRQALLNLMGNALDAMPAGGLLRVRADPTAEGTIALTVEDTGEGIGPEHLPKVFNLFYTTRSNGSGIGLSLVYRIAQLHGGDVQIDSERGTGTRVTMTLPETAQ